MIINRIRARNVLRYAELSIDLPERGLIAISGPNESGKSSIGETVCFALFGRTFSIKPDDIEKVVRWGENDCAVTLDFSVEDTRYSLSRLLDRDGNHSAKLCLADEPETPIARGVSNVADRLFGILGFEYNEFVESFYLAQREITTPHPHSHAVRIMAGIAPLETVENSLEIEISEREELRGEIVAEWESVDQDVRALGIREGYLRQIEEQQQQTADSLEQINGLISGIDGGVETYTQNATEIIKTASARGRTAFVRFIVLLLALATAGLWALLTYGADLPQAGMTHELLSEYIPQWGTEKVIWIGYLAAVLGVLFLLLWIRMAGHRRRIRTLQNESATLAELLERSRAVEVEATVADDQDPDEDDDHPLPLATRPDVTECEALCGLLHRGEATVSMVREYGERETTWLTGVAEQFSAQLAEMENDIDEEQSRLQEAINLADVLNGLADKREEIDERIADRRRALELLEGAIAHLSNNFNRDVKDLVGRLLPLFTDGRYEHLQIDEDLTVRVFSSEKRDFMDLEEVSSGTQRQVMLALRLALSKKLLSRTVKGKQFAFLDEPFAFFDEERTRRALHALADLGDDISQVWIVAQDFPRDCKVSFDTAVICDRASSSLVVKS